VRALWQALHDLDAGHNTACGVSPGAES
jgi:hypothetical protein